MKHARTKFCNVEFCNERTNEFAETEPLDHVITTSFSYLRHHHYFIIFIQLNITKNTHSTWQKIQLERRKMPKQNYRLK